MRSEVLGVLHVEIFDGLEGQSFRLQDVGLGLDIDVRGQWIGIIIPDEPSTMFSRPSLS